MQLDIERYRSYVDHFDMPEADKIELIHIVSRVMQSFVDRAFGESPEQTMLGADAIYRDARPGDPLDSTIRIIFNDAADGDAEKENHDDR